MTQRWSGVFPAVTTKFNADESLDLAATARHIRWQLDCGADGIIVCGSLGEASTLTADEKLAILQAAKAVAGDKPVLLTVAEDSTRAACALAAAAHAQGADGIMLLPAMRYVSDERETLNHYRRVAGASPLPVMIYNNPVAYGVNITPDMYRALAAEPKFAAIKESSGDIRTLTDVIISNLSVSSGGDLPSESFSLNYAVIKAKYTKQKEEGGQEGVAPFGWDISKNIAAA